MNAIIATATGLVAGIALIGCICGVAVVLRKVGDRWYFGGGGE